VQYWNCQIRLLSKKRTKSAALGAAFYDHLWRRCCLPRSVRRKKVLASSCLQVLVNLSRRRAWQVRPTLRQKISGIRPHEKWRIAAWTYREFKTSCIWTANLKLQTPIIWWCTPLANGSQIDRNEAWLPIKPSGVSYGRDESWGYGDVDLDNNRCTSSMRPSSDTKTHYPLYRHVQAFGVVTHTHSTYAQHGLRPSGRSPC